MKKHLLFLGAPGAGKGTQAELLSQTNSFLHLSTGELLRKEIEKIERLKGEKGLTCVLTKIYWKDNLIKCDIAMGKGKKHRDQREDIKKRDWERDQGRILKNSKKFS